MMRNVPYESILPVAKSKRFYIMVLFFCRDVYSYRTIRQAFVLEVVLSNIYTDLFSSTYRPRDKFPFNFKHFHLYTANL